MLRIPTTSDAPALGQLRLAVPRMPVLERGAGTIRQEVPPSGVETRPASFCRHFLVSHDLVIDPKTARELVLAVRTMIPVEEDFSYEVRGNGAGGKFDGGREPSRGSVGPPHVKSMSSEEG